MEAKSVFYHLVFRTESLAQDEVILYIEKSEPEASRRGDHCSQAPPRESWSHHICHVQKNLPEPILLTVMGDARPRAHAALAQAG